MSAIEDKTAKVFGATLSRRKFVKGSGALIVGLSLPASFAAGAGAAAAPGNQLDATQLNNWLEIRADNTILMRTGRAEMGQGSASTAYAQILAEELNVPYTAITQVVMADTDRTPDGGTSAGFLMKVEGSAWPEPFGGGALNLQRIGAYTKQALIGLAATKLGVDASQLAVKDGVVSGGGKSTTYGEIVQGQQLKLTIPTTGSVLTGGVTVVGGLPMKPVEQYSVIGTSAPLRTVPALVTGKAVMVSDIKIPGMLHARVVKPGTLGSTLISVGKLDKATFPNVQLVVKGNLVAVLSPHEYEAIQAASTVGRTTKWTDWESLPGSGNVYKALRQADWTSTPVTSRNATGNTGTAFAGAAKKFTASYGLPYYKHGPIGPATTIADVKSDGTTTIMTHNQNVQALRGKIATMLGVTPDKVIVRWFEGSGHYGRTNGGAEGAEAEAVILSQAVGHPVRVQWMRPEDMKWSTQQPPGIGDARVGLDATGNLVSFEMDHYMPVMQDDRLLGALLAGLPPTVMGSFANNIYTQWVYDKVPNAIERGHGTGNIGETASALKVGLRDHSMRTPGHMLQNFAVEGAINDAAAAAGVDPIEFRLRHTTSARTINVLNALKQAHGWQTRPSPNPQASATGSKMVKGRGMNFMLRFNTYWASAADISVNLKTGKVTVDRYTIVGEPGIVVNPLTFKRNMEGGSIQGISQTLHEELLFNKSEVTSVDWVSYPILRMIETPEIKTVILNRPDLKVAGMGGEAPNGLPMPSIAAAFFDATGVYARRLPLRPAYVRALLASKSGGTGDIPPPAGGSAGSNSTPVL